MLCLSQWPRAHQEVLKSMIGETGSVSHYFHPADPSGLRNLPSVTLSLSTTSTPGCNIKTDPVPEYWVIDLASMLSCEDPHALAIKYFLYFPSFYRTFQLHIQIEAILELHLPMRPSLSPSASRSNHFVLHGHLRGCSRTFGQSARTSGQASRQAVDLTNSISAQVLEVIHLENIQSPMLLMATIYPLFLSVHLSRLISLGASLARCLSRCISRHISIGVSLSVHLSLCASLVPSLLACLHQYISRHSPLGGYTSVHLYR